MIRILHDDYDQLLSIFLLFGFWLLCFPVSVSALLAKRVQQALSLITGFLQFFSALIFFFLQSLITVGWIDDFMMIVYRMMKKRALPDILEIGD